VATGLLCPLLSEVPDFLLPFLGSIRWSPAAPLPTELQTAAGS
jgi:hypothetical protein